MLPVFLNALTGRGVHLVTVNDYLARRDCEWMGPIFQFHGLSVDCIDRHQPNSEQRRAAYRCDIVYGTNNEFGFDYLRDNMAMRPDQLVQRKHHYAIVDEVDSVLIDEARTPSIISGPTPKGDEHEFEQLKPKVVQLNQKQRQAVNGHRGQESWAMRVRTRRLVRMGGFAAWSASARGLPKTKSLIKFLSEEGIRQQLLKTEGYYPQDNKRAMPEADEELYFVIDEKQNQVEWHFEKALPCSRPTWRTTTFHHARCAGDAGGHRRVRRRCGQAREAGSLVPRAGGEVCPPAHHEPAPQVLRLVREGRRLCGHGQQGQDCRRADRLDHGRPPLLRRTPPSHRSQGGGAHRGRHPDLRDHHVRTTSGCLHKLGMTGTAETEAQELWDIYKLDVMSIPTNRPIARKDEDDLVSRPSGRSSMRRSTTWSTSDAGCPVLVGTTTVEVSELLSRMLDIRKIEHQVLNAKATRPRSRPARADSRAP